MKEKKYTNQISYLRTNYKRFPIDFKINVLEEFKIICKQNNTTPTAVIKKFVNDYISLYKK